MTHSSENDQRILNIEATLRHHQWIPGQTYPAPYFSKMSVRGQMHESMGSLLPTPDIEQMVGASSVHDLIGQALADYQGVHILQDAGQVYFPYAFNLEIGSQILSANGKEYTVTKVYENRDGTVYWNPYYRRICGQIVNLSGPAEFDEVLFLGRPANLFHTMSYPDGEIVEFLENSQLKSPMGIATRLLSSKPFEGDNKISHKYGYKEGEIDHPSRKDLKFEVMRFNEETIYEILSFSADRIVADQLSRYVKAVLRAYRPKFKQAGVDDVCWEGRGPDEHLHQGREGRQFKTSIHIRRDKWYFKTTETLLTMFRPIDRLRFTLDLTTLPAKLDTQTGEITGGKGYLIEDVFRPKF